MTIVLNEVVSPNSTSVMNANFSKIEDAINDDLLKREIEVGEANEMRTHLDLNSNKTVNMQDGVDATDGATVGQMEAFQATISDGEDGYTPVKGVDYFDGVDGIDGAPGAQGIQGEQGLQGIQGEPGVDGADGADGSGSGIVLSVVAGTNVTVDATDPANPIVSSTDTLPNKVDIGAFVAGVPTDASKIITHTVSTAFTIPAGMTGSQAYAEVAPTATAGLTISKNGGGALGTVDFALGANTGTFTFVTPTAFATGDRLQIVNQGVADATLADISLTIRGDL